MKQTASQRAADHFGEVLEGRGRGLLRDAFVFAGPAVIASIAYMDPGNFATNIQAGSQFGYALLWVVVLANATAMLFQALSAKLGIVTGSNLAELCRAHWPRPLVLAMWAISEIAAMATDLAEFVGGAIGFALLLHVPLLVAMVITAVLTFAILAMEKHGFRPLELIIGALVVTIMGCYLVEMAIAPIDWRAVGLGAVLPTLPGREAVAIAVGIIGATVMPHALYLHSGLTQNRAAPRDMRQRRRLLGFSNREVVIALSAAGLVNIAMVVMAASVFHAGHADVAAIETAYHSLGPLLGSGAAAVFLLSLIASGISSSVVGTMAGQMIMQGFVGFRIPLWVRRLVTIVPAFIVIGLGVDATTALIDSQIVLSFALPFPMIALVVFTRRPDLMGEFRNATATQVAAVAGAVVVLALNVILILQAFNVPLPGL